ncbi:hypothetical protein Y032_0007g3177 [Ancylostoma ceylanicum]|uniref:Uncharacterized protein n=1 Tax=Ancylostoma ceylanicum TaxID=53326 RepID=A0A016VLP7_9BILA|nr:hypothetical protein Y032_0007g3177 [Ancylostoma ceylanicum]
MLLTLQHHTVLLNTFHPTPDQIRRVQRVELGLVDGPTKLVSGAPIYSTDGLAVLAATALPCLAIHTAPPTLDHAKL